MSKELTIRINGETYPCRMTMGAMLRFREETGHDVGEFDGSVRDLCAMVWALVTSAAKREGRQFGMTFWEFCDNVDAEEMQRCWEAVNSGGGEPEGEKKSPPGP